jgi:hypothetical protein
MFQDINVKTGSGFTTTQMPTADYLVASNFLLQIPTCPILSQTCRVTKLPRLNSGAATMLSPLLNIPLIGDSLMVEPLMVTFPILSDFSNYMEVHSWINFILTANVDLETSKTVERILGMAALTGGVQRSTKTADNITGCYTDATLIILDRNNIPVVNVEFYGMIPTDISEVTFDVTNTSQDPITCTVTFKYMYYKITPVAK